MSNAALPAHERFRTGAYGELMAHRAPGEWVVSLTHGGEAKDWFLCGEAVWRSVDELKAYDAKHGTHYAEDCANAARAAFLDEAEDARGHPKRWRERADALQAVGAWTAWLREEG